MNTEFSCQEMIEVVTNYLDDALPPDEQQRLEELRRKRQQQVEELRQKQGKK